MLRKCLVFLLFTTLCYAQNPKLIGYPPQTIMGFRGLDTRTSAPLLQDGRASDLKNVKLSRSFDLEKRRGYDPVDDTLDDLDIDSPAINGIFYMEYSNGNERIYAFVGKKLKYDSGTAWTEVTDSPEGHKVTGITTGKNNQWQCISALDYAVCTNDTDLPLKIDSTPEYSDLDLSDLSDAVTKVKTVIWYKNYLVLGNTVEAGTEYPTRARWSNVGTIQSWTDEDYIDIGALAGDEIVGFAELYGDLYAFLRNSIYKASFVGGDDVFTVNKVIENIGSIARDSIQTILLEDNRRAIIFLDEDKRVYLFNGATITDIGWIIQPTLDNLNSSRIQYSVSTFDGDSYYLSSSTSGVTENDSIYEFQTEVGEWTKHTDINANAFGQIKDSSVVKTYFGNYDAHVYWLDNPDYTSDGGDGTGYVGVVESVGTVNTRTITGAQFIKDSTPGFSTTQLTGCLFKITSGTGAGEEQVIVYNTSTGVAVATAFTTTPTTTSNYSIGAIDAAYTTKWYDFGDSPRLKNFRKLFLWGEESTGDEVIVSYSVDFGSTLGSEAKNLSPSTSSLWDSALWDIGVWGTTGDKFYTTLLSGYGRMIEYKFENADINENFHLYGFHMLADVMDVE